MVPLAQIPSGRFGEAIVELQSLLERLRGASDEERRPIYAECVPLLAEANELNRHPLPRKEVKSLLLEAGWHLRSLAGVAIVGGNTSDEHHSWAQHSLSGLEAWSARHPAL